jgi:hypothetical protein
MPVIPKAVFAEDLCTIVRPLHDESAFSSWRDATQKFVPSSFPRDLLFAPFSNVGHIFNRTAPTAPHNV